MKSLPIATVALLLLTGVAAAVPASTASADDGRKPASCDHRVCLRVVEQQSDTDGDGVTDLDEDFLGTDPRDAASFPAGQKLIDAALMRELPSFESHLTELVVLPQMTTDFSALATAVGLMDLPTASWGTTNAPHLLGDLGKNGFTGILSGLGITLPGSGNALPEGSDAAQFTYMQQVMDSTSSTSFTFPNIAGWGANNGKSGGETTVGQTRVSTENGITRLSSGTSTYYPDGSHDGTSLEGRKTSTSTQTKSVTTSSDRMGNTVSQTVTTSSSDKDPKTGKTTTTTTTTTTGYSKDGRITGAVSQTTKVTTDPKTGTKTTETSGSTTNSDGTVTPVEPQKKTEKCQTKDCSDGMSDPDYVTFGPLTADDYNRVMARIDAVRTPGPDSGILTDNPPQVPTRDIYSNYSGDGVVVLSATPNPRFNIAQPEYNGELAEMAQLGGTVPPNPNADDPTGYWPDKP
ncbi:MAG TPA: thrombospondin type 3 repeat-containing protein [Pseudolysinimonas sp.]|nr:thrombospondin type 3 repeat-containing protein [Pseudolysinimonas sp.]